MSGCHYCGPGVKTCPSDPAPERITHVAIRYDGFVYGLPAPNRHHDVIRHAYEVYGVRRCDVGDHEQGFVDEAGVYLTREEAFVRAQATGQLRRREGVQFYQGPMLFSEDLW